MRRIAPVSAHKTLIFGDPLYLKVTIDYTDDKADATIKFEYGKNGTIVFGGRQEIQDAEKACELIFSGLADLAIINAEGLDYAG